MASRTTLEEKLDKIRSPNLQSQKQTGSILQGIEATLKERKTEVTPTAYFAALLSLLDQKSLVIPVVYLLDVVSPFVPGPILRAKFTQILSLLAPVISQPDAEAPLLKPSIGCMEQLLVAQDAEAWAMSAAQIGPRRAVAGLLSLSLDQRPKVRRRAQDALKKILMNPPPSPSLDHPASAMCAETAMKQLRELTERTAQSKKGKKISGPVHDPDLMHALQLVKALASASGGWPSKKIEPLCELLIGIARCGTEHLVMAVFDVFEMMFEGMANDTASTKLPRLLDVIRELRPATDDTQLLPAWIAILSRAYDVSAQVEPEETFQSLVEPFRLVAAYLESDAESIRISSSECLISFIASCIPFRIILEPSMYDEKVLQQLAVVVEGLLTVNFHAAWRETFKLVGAMLDALRWRSSPYLLRAIQTIGEMRSNDSFTGKPEADEVLGKAIRAMGPEAVLAILPLNLVNPLKGQPGRAWMLPILRNYTSNTKLAHFMSEFVPLSQVMYQRVMEAAEKTLEVKIYETIVQQIWTILPGYCDLPLDLVEAFDRSFVELLTGLLYEQVDLRLDICRALRQLVDSNQAIASSEEEDDLLLQSRISIAVAKQNLDYLGQTFAADILAVLFNVYRTTSQQKRGPILQTVNAFISITPKERLMTTFDLVCQLLAQALEITPSHAAGGKSKLGGEHMPSEAQTLMDLVVTMAIYLPRESFEALFKVASLVIVRQDEPQLQKKAYKLIPRLEESATGKLALEERHAEMQQLLLSSVDKVSSPARRERLAAIGTLISFLRGDLWFIPVILSEVVVGCKEQNEKARAVAFDVLVAMGHAMADSKGALIDNSKVPNMPKDAPSATASVEEFLTMVSAGLAGSTPHMISASVIALTRVLYEFRETLSKEMLVELIQTMDLFLTSNNREIVKSVLGFVKVCVISLPSDVMLPRLQALIPNLMVWSHEHKGHFKSKVKHILERMMRCFGFDTVNRYCSEADRKLLANIRKTRDRSKKKRKTTKDEEGGREGPSGKRVGRFESEYDLALCSSDEADDSDGSDDEVMGRPTKRGQKGANTYIIEDGEEPLDLLDRNALAKISSTQPSKLKRPVKSKVKTNLDGKILLGQEDGEDDMDIDEPGDREDTGVGAYVAALKGKEVPRRGRGGKLKFSNRRSRVEEDDDDGMDIDHAIASTIKTKLDAKHKVNRQARGGARGRSGRIGKGGIQASRRGLGEDKRRGPAIQGRGGKVGKGRP